MECPGAAVTAASVPAPLRIPLSIPTMAKTAPAQDSSGLHTVSNSAGGIPRRGPPCSAMVTSAPLGDGRTGWEALGTAYSERVLELVRELHADELVCSSSHEATAMQTRRTSNTERRSRAVEREGQHIEPTTMAAGSPPQTRYAHTRDASLDVCTSMPCMAPRITSVPRSALRAVSMPCFAPRITMPSDVLLAAMRADRAGAVNALQPVTREAGETSPAPTEARSSVPTKRRAEMPLAFSQLGVAEKRSNALSRSATASSTSQTSTTLSEPARCAEPHSEDASCCCEEFDDSASMMTSWSSDICSESLSASAAPGADSAVPAVGCPPYPAPVPAIRHRPDASAFVSRMQPVTLPVQQVCGDDRACTSNCMTFSVDTQVPVVLRGRSKPSGGREHADGSLLTDAPKQGRGYRFTPSEDQHIVQLRARYNGNWNEVAQAMTALGFNRTKRSLFKRWTNQLSRRLKELGRPDLTSFPSKVSSILEVLGLANAIEPPAASASNARSLSPACSAPGGMQPNHPGISGCTPSNRLIQLDPLKVGRALSLDDVFAGELPDGLMLDEPAVSRELQNGPWAHAPPTGGDLLESSARAVSTEPYGLLGRVLTPDLLPLSQDGLFNDLLAIEGDDAPYPRGWQDQNCAVPQQNNCIPGFGLSPDAACTADY